MSQNDWHVYVHIVPAELSGYDHDKYYFGVARDYKKRWGKDGKGYITQPFYSAIQKYGWENITHKILYDNLSKESALEKEKELIKQYDSKLGRKGYNGTDGGEGGMGHKSSRAHIVICLDPQMAFRSSLVCSRYFGIGQSNVTRCCRHEKGCTTTKGYKFIYIDEYEKSRGLKSCAVICLETLKFYPTYVAASEDTGADKGAIKKCCDGIIKSTCHKKYHWMYLKDYLYERDYVKPI